MKTPNTQGRSTKTKTPVFGMMERSEVVNAKGDTEFMSFVRAMVVEKTDRATLLPLIGQFIGEGSTVFTDELNAYNKVSEMGVIPIKSAIMEHCSLFVMVRFTPTTSRVFGLISDV